VTAPIESSTVPVAGPSAFGLGRAVAGVPATDATLRRLLVATDSAAIGVALALTARAASGSAAHIGLSLLTIPVWILILQAYGLYDRDMRRISHTTVADVPHVFHAMLLGGVLFWLYSRVALPDDAHAEVLVLAALGGLLILNFRSILRRAARHFMRPQRVLLVGEGETIALLARKLRAHPEYCAEPAAVAGVGADLGVPVVSGVDDLDLGRIVSEYAIDRLVVSNEDMSPAVVLALVREANCLSLNVSIVPQPCDAIGASVEIDDVEGVTLFGVCPPALSRPARVAKRGLDLAAASILLVLLAPLMVALAIAVRLDSEGPAFFRQERIGRGGRRFRILKFRTMVSGAETMHDALAPRSRDAHWLLLDRDPRITRIGAVLRRMSLDELPQLWNVARGQMSLVGPRPLIPEEHYQVSGWGRRRVDMAPGLTGLWQVLGRTSIPFEEMVKLDYLYVANWSLWRDIDLLLRTIPILLNGRGAN
jgi:exopolysaccharide biosynthesis polyprenyl glycosylphosphotransferase